MVVGMVLRDGPFQQQEGVLDPGEGVVDFTDYSYGLPPTAARGHTPRPPGMLPGWIGDGTLVERLAAAFRPRPARSPLAD